MPADRSVARVYLLDVPYHIDKLYDYYIPEDIRGTVCEGSFVIVPFGGGNKKQLAVIGELSGASAYAKLKPVISVACCGLTVSREMIGLGMYMKEHFLCTVGDAIKAMIPKSALTKLKNVYYPVGDIEKDLPEKYKYVYSYIRAGRKADENEIISKFGSDAPRILAKLTLDGVIRREAVLTDSKTVVNETVVLTEEYRGKSAEDLMREVRGERQKQLASILSVTGSEDYGTLHTKYGFTKTHLKPLEERGIVKIIKENVYRDPYSRKIKEEPKQVVLSAAQEDARKQLSALALSGEPKAALLYGVTGSGKTNVIKAVMDDVIASGRSVIMMVPEIALTPQTVGIFRAHYGDRAVVIHSGLSNGERYDAWRKIRDGEADLCIGTRSAVFAPFDNLGMIVLDEEQEHTYKSDMDPKYNARDIARYRCAGNRAFMLLASATPSVESYRKAKDGKYSLVTLTERYGNAELPETVITDRRIDAKAGNISPIGSELRRRLSETLEKGEQAILFINQRGYNKFLSCPLCGNVLTCSRCSVSYTYHTVPYSDGGYLFCHYCGTKEPVPKKCPQCGNDVMKHVGYGTQMVEEELRRIFPSARTMRMDADTTGTKLAYDDLLGKFRDGEADILIGTQMVTKGHDFPNVTLVGVINADSSLYLSDYKANERTFDLLTQVIGRAGRGSKPGCALIQTSNPDHPVLRLAAKQDYGKMYENESALRRSLVFPPYCDMVLFTLGSEDENELAKAAGTLRDLFGKINAEKFPSAATVVFGPMEAPIYKINGVFRMRMVIKCRFSAETRRLISSVYSEYSKLIGNKITVSVDVNPNDL